MLTAEDPAMATRACFILWGSLGLAVGTTAVVWVARKLGASNSAAESEWSFSGSWATNITLVGALLGTVLATVELESPVYLSENVYVGFTVLFGVMTVLAPLLYTVFSTSSNPQENVRSFLAAGTLTQWGVVGQIATLTYLEWELALDGSFAPGGASLLWGLLVLGIALVLVYCGRTMHSILSKKPPAGAKLPLPL